MEELFVKLEETLNSNRFTRAIMPYAEVILFGSVLLTMLSIVPSITIWLAAILCLAKRKFGALSIAFSVATLHMLYELVKSFRGIFYLRQIDIFGIGLSISRNSYFNIWTSFVSLLIFGGATYLILWYYFKTDQGKLVKEKVFKRVNELKTTSTAASTETTESAATTENTVTTENTMTTENTVTTDSNDRAIIVDSPVTDQEVETLEDDVAGATPCANCNHQNVSNAKFCGNCGQPLSEV